MEDLTHDTIPAPTCDTIPAPMDVDPEQDRWTIPNLKTADLVDTTWGVALEIAEHRETVPITVHLVEDEMFDNTAA